MSERRRVDMRTRSKYQTYLIFTASDPAASSLQDYLEEQHFTIQAGPELAETARILVDLVRSKKQLVEAIKDWKATNPDVGPYKIKLKYIDSYY